MILVQCGVTNFVEKSFSMIRIILAVEKKVFQYADRSCKMGLGSLEFHV